MPRYVISSESPISVRGFGRPGQGLPWPGRPTDPGWGIDEGEVGGGGDEGVVAPPWIGPGRPGHGLPPQLPEIPPKDEWPPLPPWLQPGVGLPIPPTPEHPMVPVPPSGGTDEEVEIWPPIRPPFEIPDFSGKTLALALVFVSRHVAAWHWVVIDHEKAKDKLKEALGAIKDKLPTPPAGGVGRPPERPTPGVR